MATPCAPTQWAPTRVTVWLGSRAVDGIAWIRTSVPDTAIPATHTQFVTTLLGHTHVTAWWGTMVQGTFVRVSDQCFVAALGCLKGKLTQK